MSNCHPLLKSVGALLTACLPACCLHPWYSQERVCLNYGFAVHMQAAGDDKILRASRDTTYA